ncbi:MAG: helix-turn-helix domain-containing protein [Candidatus Uhrbacteria bacterium]
MKDIAPILKTLGLLDSEVKVYLVALELGPSTVIEIAGKTRLSRPATYTAINALADRGLMSTVTQGKRRLFASEHPDRLVQYAKRKEQELSEHVSDLERALPALNLRVGGEKPVVKAFEGKEGIHAIIEDLRLSRPKEIEEISNIDAMRAVLAPEDLEPMRRELTRIGARVRGLYAGSSVSREQNADARALPKEFAQFNGNITIYGNKMALVTFTGQLHSVIIENDALAQTMRTMFELAWKGASELPEVPVEGEGE